MENRLEDLETEYDDLAEVRERLQEYNSRDPGAYETPDVIYLIGVMEESQSYELANQAEDLVRNYLEELEEIFEEEFLKSLDGEDRSKPNNFEEILFKYREIEAVHIKSLERGGGFDDFSQKPADSEEEMIDMAISPILYNDIIPILEAN